MAKITDPLFVDDCRRWFFSKVTGERYNPSGVMDITDE